MWRCDKNTDRMKRLLADEGGVVSFEYVIVAFCLVTVVLAAFGTNAGSAMGTGLTNTLNAIVAAITALVGA